MRWLRNFTGRRGDEPSPATPAELRDERLSAYLDGELTAADTAALERELAGSVELRAELEMLGDVRSALRSLGEVRAPRSFALAAAPAPPPRRLIGMELITPLATVAAGLLFVFVLVAPGGETVSSDSAGTAAMSAPQAGAGAAREAQPPGDATPGASLAAPAPNAAPEATAAANAAAAAESAADTAAGGEAGSDKADGASEQADAATPATSALRAQTGDAVPAFEPAAGDGTSTGAERGPFTIGLGALTAVLAVLTFRQWRRRREPTARG